LTHGHENTLTVSIKRENLLCEERVHRPTNEKNHD